MDELSEAEEQYQRNLRAHAEAIDNLLITYKERMEREKGNYERILKQTLDQTDVETNKLYSRQNQDEILLQSITRGIEREMEESLNNVKGIVLSTCCIRYSVSHTYPMLSPRVCIKCKLIYA